MPLQSGSSEILKKMNRHYTKEQYLELAERIRKAVPDISLTTDIIVGFPGETEEDFEETLEVVRKVRYEDVYKRQGKLGVLVYRRQSVLDQLYFIRRGVPGRGFKYPA